MDENSSDRAAMVSRRGVLAATGTATVAVVAGCSGGDDTPSVPGTASSDIEELAIVDHQPDFAPGSQDQDFGVVLTIENNGDQQADIIDYSYELTPYDDDDNDISGMTAGFKLTDDETGTGMSPGGRGSVMATTSLGPSRDEVARYEVTLDCGFDGTYCE